MKAVRELFNALRGWEWWPLVASIALIMTFLAGFYWRSDVRAVFCTTANDEHCGREWVSALSGWAAVIAAIVTVHFLKRQIEEANRHQRENLELSIMGKMHLAMRCFTHCLELASQCRMVEKMFTANFFSGYSKAGGAQPVLAGAIKTLQGIQSGLEDEIIAEYQREVGWVDGTAAGAIDKIKMNIEVLQRMAGDAGPAWVPDQTELNHLCGGIRRAANFAGAVAETSKTHSFEFITKWSSRLSDHGNRNNHSG